MDDFDFGLTDTSEDIETRRFTIEMTLSFEMPCHTLPPLYAMLRDQSLAECVTLDISELLAHVEDMTDNFSYWSNASSEVI